LNNWSAPKLISIDYSLPVTASDGWTIAAPALADRTPAEFAAICSSGNDGDKTALENAPRLPHFHRTAAAAGDLTNAPVSRLLLETIT